MNLDRTSILLGEENLNKIINTKIVIVGIGGVGGYTLESLVRMGIKDITIIDYDKFEETNINRQLLCTKENIGSLKVVEALKRYKSINPDLNLTCINNKLSKDNINMFLKNKPDYIIDACDDIEAKVQLIKYSSLNNIKIITCCGTAKRIDASLLEVIRLDKTENDPLAKKLRSELRKENISLNIPCLHSKELPKEINILGSVSYVPAVAGLLITNYIVNDIIN